MLEIWTIYDHPRDFPNSFVARKFILDKPTKDILIDANLQGIRSLVQGYSNTPLMRIGRSPGDDPKIVESWL